MEIFEDELECLKSSFNSSEFQFIISSKFGIFKSLSPGTILSNHVNFC